MKVSANITRWDLLRMNLYLLPRSSSSYIGILLLWAVIFFTRDQSGMFSREALIYAISSFIVVTVAITAFSALVVLVYIVLAYKTPGVLGQHEFSILESGLMEETDDNQTLTKWKSISKVHKSRSSIYVRLSWYLFHIIPARAFDSLAEYEHFYESIHERVGT